MMILKYIKVVADSYSNLYTSNCCNQTASLCFGADSLTGSEADHLYINGITDTMCLLMNVIDYFVFL